MPATDSRTDDPGADTGAGAAVLGAFPGRSAGPSARVSSRLAGISPSATLTIDARAKALREAGEDIIGFGAGEPDFPTPASIVEAAVEACRDPRNHHYTPSAGLPELRRAIAAKTARDTGFEVGSERVLVTNGGKQAVFNAFSALLDPGDEVLVPAPYWTTYPESISLAGGVTVVVPADETTGFKVDVGALEAACTPRTKVVLFVSPSNPTGAVYERPEIEAVGRFAAETGLFVVTDEIYEHLTYGGRSHHSMPVVVPQIEDRCVVLNGVAKTYAMTGWRVGWMIGPADVVEAASNMQSHVTSNVSNVSQRAALAAVSGDLSAVAQMRTAFDARRRVMHRMLNEIPGVSCVEPEGAFYAFPSLAGLLGRSFSGVVPITSAELAEVALDQARVAMVPGEAFGAPGYARLSYAMADDAMTEGLRRLATLVESSKPAE